MLTKIHKNKSLYVYRLGLKSGQNERAGKNWATEIPSDIRTSIPVSKPILRSSGLRGMVLILWLSIAHCVHCTCIQTPYLSQPPLASPLFQV